MAINIPRADVLKLISKARTMKPSQYEGFSDFEIYQDIRQQYPQYTFSDGYPAEMYISHQLDLHAKSDLVHSPEDTPSDPAFKGEDPEWYNQRGKVYDPRSAYFRGVTLGLTDWDWVPDYLQNPIRSGANESITGLAVHIISGQAPFDIDDKYHPDMIQNAIGLGASLVSDFYFFTNPVTGFAKGASMFASTAVRRKAALELSKHFMAKNAVKGIVEKGVAPKVAEKMVEETLKGVGRAVGRSAAIETEVAAVKQALLKIPVSGIDDALVRTWGDDALKSASKFVDESLGHPDWMRMGSQYKNPLTGKNELFLSKPRLRDLMLRGGLSAGKALGLYNVVGNWEHQVIRDIAQTMNPETGEPYGDKAPNLFEQWRQHGDNPLYPLTKIFAKKDWAEVLYAGTHGFLGGFAIGALGMVGAAGRAGAFSSGKSGYNKFWRNNPNFERRLTSGLGKYTAMVGAEAVGFEGGKLLTDAMFYAVGKPLGWDLPHHRPDRAEYDPRNWYERVPEGLLQGIVTIGFLKGTGYGKERMKAYSEKEVSKHLSRIREAQVKEDNRLERINDELGPETPNNKVAKEGIEKKRQENRSNYENEKKEVSRVYFELTTLWRKAAEKPEEFTVQDLDRLNSFRKRYVELMEAIETKLPEGDSLFNSEFHMVFRGKDKEWDIKVDEIKKSLSENIDKEQKRQELINKQQDQNNRTLEVEDLIYVTEEGETSGPYKITGFTEDGKIQFSRDKKDGTVELGQTEKDLVSKAPKPKVEEEVTFTTNVKSPDKNEQVPSNSPSFHEIEGIDGSGGINSLSQVKKALWSKFRIKPKKGATIEELRETLDTRMLLEQQKLDQTKKAVKLALEEEASMDIKKEIQEFEDSMADVENSSIPEKPFDQKLRQIQTFITETLPSWAKNKIIKVSGSESNQRKKIKQIIQENASAMMALANKMKTRSGKNFANDWKYIEELALGLAKEGRSLKDVKVDDIHRLAKAEFNKSRAEHYNTPGASFMNRILKSMGELKDTIPTWKDLDITLKDTDITDYMKPKGREKVPLTQEESDKIRTNIHDLLHSNDKPFQFMDNSSLSNAAGKFLYKVFYHMGFRGVAIHGREGTTGQGTQRQILLRDVSWHKDVAGEYVRIKIIEKGKSKYRKKPEALDYIDFRKGDKDIDGIEYYEVVKTLEAEAKAQARAEGRTETDLGNSFLVQKKNKHGKFSYLTGQNVRMFGNFMFTLKPSLSSLGKGRPAFHEALRGRLADLRDSVADLMFWKTRANEVWNSFTSRYLLGHTPQLVEGKIQVDSSYGWGKTKRAKAAFWEMTQEVMETLQRKPSASREELQSIINKHSQLWEKRFGKHLDTKVKETNPFTILLEDSIKKQATGITGQKVASTKELLNQLLRYQPKHSMLKVILDKTGTPKNYAGAIIRDTIEIVAGRASLSTYFHEVLHHYHDVFSNGGNPAMKSLWNRGEMLVKNYAPKNDSARWDKFVEAYGDKAAFEYLTQIGAEWSLKRSKAMDPHGRFIDKITYWFENMYRKFKGYIGIRNEKDIARIFGEKIEKGYFGKSKDADPLLSDRILKSVGSVLRNEDFFGPGRIIIKEDGGGFKKGDLVIQKGFDGTEKGIKFEKSDMDKDLAGADLIKELRDAMDSSIAGKWGKNDILYVANFLGIKFMSMENLTKDEAHSLINATRSIDFDVEKDSLGALGIEGLGKPMKRKESWNALNRETRLLDRKHGIIKETRNAIMTFLNVKDGSTRNANEHQMKEYTEFLKELDLEDYTNSSYFLEKERLETEILKSHKRADKFLNSLHGKFIMSTDFVMRSFGADKIADQILEHTRYETIWAGEGHYTIGEVKRSLQKHYGLAALEGLTFKWQRGMNSLVYTLDPDRAKGVELDSFTQEFVKQAGIEGTPENIANAKMRKILDEYHGQLTHIAKQQIKNPKLLETFLEKHNKSYVEDYFTKILTPEGKTLIVNHEANIVEGFMTDTVNQFNKKWSARIQDMEKKIIDLNIAQMSPADRNVQISAIKRNITRIKKIQADLTSQGMTPGTDLYNRLSSHATVQYENLLSRKRNKVVNPYMLDRVSNLPSFMKDKDGKRIKVWEDDFETVMGQYFRVYSNYLATTKFFPEFTDMYKPLDTKTSAFSTAERLMLFMGRDESGAFIRKTLARRIGMDPADQGGQSLHRHMGTLGKYSALLGLSSGFSGLKNLTIGTAIAMGEFGFTNYLRSVKKIFNPWNPDSKELRKYLKKLGLPLTGTKELEITGPIAAWMKYVSWMTPTEMALRMTSAYSGILYAETLVDRMRGKTWMPFKNWTGKRAEKQLESLFRLTKDEIADLKNNGLRRGEDNLIPSPEASRVGNTIGSIRDKILYHAQVETQGSTAISYLPQWWSQRNVQAATLFYRMAYSGTANIYTHIYKPAMGGNLMPLFRHTFAGYLGGGALWSLYSSILGQESPKENLKDNGELMSTLMQNLWKNEALGLFTFMISPYGDYKNWNPIDNLQQDSVMTPAVFRNTAVAGILAYNLAAAVVKGTILKPIGLSERHHNDITEILDNGIRQTFVFYNHAQRAYQNANTPYQRDFSKVKAWRQSFLRDMGYWKHENMSNPYHKMNNQFMRTEQGWMYNMIKEAFNAGDYEAAAKFYMATKYYLYDHYRVIDGRPNMFHRTARAQTESILKRLEKHLNPLHFSDDLGKRVVPKIIEFQEYLSPENLILAKNLEKQYYYKVRQMRKVMAKYEKIHGLAWKEGQMMDLLPVPPNWDIGGVKGKWWQNWEGRKSMKWDRKDRLDDNPGFRMP